MFVMLPTRSNVDDLTRITQNADKVVLHTNFPLYALTEFDVVFHVIYKFIYYNLRTM